MNLLIKLTCLFLGFACSLPNLGARPFPLGNPRLLAYGAMLDKIKEGKIIIAPGTPVFIINDGARWQGIEICEALQQANKNMIFLPYDYHSTISEEKGTKRLLDIAYRLNIGFVSLESNVLTINVSLQGPGQYFPDYLITLQFSVSGDSYQIIEEGDGSFFYKKESKPSSGNLPD